MTTGGRYKGPQIKDKRERNEKENLEAKEHQHSGELRGTEEATWEVLQAHKASPRPPPLPHLSQINTATNSGQVPPVLPSDRADEQTCHTQGHRGLREGATPCLVNILFVINSQGPTLHSEWLPSWVHNPERATLGAEWEGGGGMGCLLDILAAAPA